MMYRGILLVLCMGVSLGGSAYADFRVLFTFDSSGVKARHVVEVAATGENYPATLAELPVLPVANMVMMKWRDANGMLLAVTQMPDPRITRSPQHVDPSSVSSVGVTEGAWVGDGPDNSEVVTIEFPENVALGLSPETWPVSLRQDN